MTAEKRRIPRGLSGFIAALLALAALVWGIDRLFYGSLIFLQENHSGWDSYRWYNFESRYRDLERERGRYPDDLLVLITGSSIAKYSVQEHVLDPLLSGAAGRRVRVRFWGHAAASPTDLYYYAPRMLALRPDLVVYISGPADLDLERYVPPWEVGPAYDNEMARAFVLIRHPLQINYPGAFALDQVDRLSMEDLARFSLHGIIGGPRFRDQWWEPNVFNWRAGRRVLRGYLNYQGVQLPEGTYREGHTVSCLSFSYAALDQGEFTFEVPPALAAVPGFRIDFFRADPPEQHSVPDGFAMMRDYLWNGGGEQPENFRATLGAYLKRPDVSRDCRAVGAPVLSLEQPGLGWHTVSVPGPQDGAVLVRLTHVLSDSGAPLSVSGDSIVVGRGLRLPAQFGLRTPRTRDILVRRAGWYDRQLRALSGNAIVQEYETRVQPGDWKEREELLQLNRIRLAHYHAEFHGFQESMLQFKRFALFADRLNAGGTRLLFVNNPENPISLDDYASGLTRLSPVGPGRAELERRANQGPARWYAGYLLALLELEETGRIGLLDLHDLLPANRFQDPHHLNYYGMLEMAPVYADAIVDALQDTP